MSAYKQTWRTHLGVCEALRDLLICKDFVQRVLMARSGVAFDEGLSVGQISGTQAKVKKQSGAITTACPDVGGARRRCD